MIERDAGGGHRRRLACGRQQDLEPAGHGLAEDAEKLGRARRAGGRARSAAGSAPDASLRRVLAGASGVVGVWAQLVRSGHKNLEVDFPNMIYDAS